MTPSFPFLYSALPSVTKHYTCTVVRAIRTVARELDFTEIERPDLTDFRKWVRM